MAFRRETNLSPTPGVAVGSHTDKNMAGNLPLGIAQDILVITQLVALRLPGETDRKWNGAKGKRCWEGRDKGPMP